MYGEMFQYTTSMYSVSWNDDCQLEYPFEAIHVTPFCRENIQ